MHLTFSPWLTHARTLARPNLVPNLGLRIKNQLLTTMDLNSKLEKPCKARGHPKKATIANMPTVEMNKKPAPTNATTSKCIRDNIASVDEEGNQGVSKCTKADETSVDQLPPPLGTTRSLLKTLFQAARAVMSILY